MIKHQQHKNLLRSLFLAVLLGVTGMTELVSQNFVPLIPSHEKLDDQTAKTFFTRQFVLNQGNNWFSTNIDITLNDLKAALEGALPEGNITIKSQTQNTSYDPNNHDWSGSLTWDVTKMYEIWVGSACEIMLEGLARNPAEHPVTIGNGSNWIAYPLNESKSVSTIFTEFAIDGDVVRSQTGNASYRNGRWSGVFNLEPGKGYIYKSAASSDRTFSF